MELSTVTVDFCEVSEIAQKVFRGVSEDFFCDFRALYRLLGSFRRSSGALRSSGGFYVVSESHSLGVSGVSEGTSEVFQCIAGISEGYRFDSRAFQRIFMTQIKIIRITRVFSHANFQSRRITLQFIFT